MESVAQSSTEGTSESSVASRLTLWVPIILVAGLIFGGGIWRYQAFRLDQALETADAQLKKGFPALAMETVDAYRRRGVTTPKGCKILVTTYFRMRKADRLQWTSESCIDAGIDISESYLGLAASHEFNNRDMDALKVLNEALPKFERLPDLYYRMGQIFRRNNNDRDAGIAFMKAAERAPANGPLNLEALEVLSKLQMWPQARQVAERIMTLPTEDPGVKLLIARALLNTGDKPGATLAIAEAHQLLDKKTPEQKKEIEKIFGDILRK